MGHPVYETFFSGLLHEIVHIVCNSFLRFINYLLISISNKHDRWHEMSWEEIDDKTDLEQ